ncbi:MAG: alpha/beta fold hydrolase [Oscillochloris sp.]|nr:alpha/beta fold hydrolase [Oscillochloris sp.]
MSEPFLFSGSNHGCLLVHGFSGKPGELHPLGIALAERGHTVFAPRLPGHYGDPAALAVINWHDWLGAVQSAYRYMLSRCTTVSLVGFSLGGALSILIAAQQPPRRLVLLATPLAINADPWIVAGLPLARYTMPWFYPFERADFADPQVRAQILARQPDADLDDPELQTYLRRHIRISTGAIDELRRTLSAARTALPHVQTPVLVMHGRDDDIALPQSAQTIFRTIGSRSRQLIWWDNTAHQMLVLGPQRDAIIRQVCAFLETEC